MIDVKKKIMEDKCMEIMSLYPPVLKQPKLDKILHLKLGIPDLTMKCTTFLDITLQSPLKINHCFGGTLPPSICNCELNLESIKNIFLLQMYT
jgi:hypothetical protein